MRQSATGTCPRTEMIYRGRLFDLTTKGGCSHCVASSVREGGKPDSQPESKSLEWDEQGNYSLFNIIGKYAR